MLAPPGSSRQPGACRLDGDLLDLPTGVGRERRGGVHDRLESESADFHEAVRDRFLALAGADPDRYLVVDGQLPVDEISELIRGRVATLPAVNGLRGVSR
jgi:dTMP kinase